MQCKSSDAYYLPSLMILTTVLSATRLPTELRNMLYQYALGNVTIE